MKHYTMRDFNKEFKSEKSCLQAVFDNRYGKAYKCPKCGVKGHFYAIESRKRYDCQCGYGVYPLANTIFHKSETPLTLWFFAIFLFASSRNGVAAKELERQLGVTYKTAWRMAKQIRTLFAQGKTPLKGTIETDETYVGGKRKEKRGLGAEGKTIVFGMIERKGTAMSRVVPNVRMATLQPIINSSAEKNSTIMTDELRSYSRVKVNGYNHETVKHGIGEYVRENVHMNGIEGFWSQLKRSISGTHHAVSPKHLQSYVDEFVYRYNYRFSSLFPLMFQEVAKRSGLENGIVV